MGLRFELDAQKVKSPSGKWSRIVSHPFTQQISGCSRLLLGFTSKDQEFNFFYRKVGVKRIRGQDGFNKFFVSYRWVVGITKYRVYLKRFIYLPFTKGQEVLLIIISDTIIRKFYDGGLFVFVLTGQIIQIIPRSLKRGDDCLRPHPPLMY